MQGFKSCGVQFWRNFASITSRCSEITFGAISCQTISNNLIVGMNEGGSHNAESGCIYIGSISSRRKCVLLIN